MNKEPLGFVGLGVMGLSIARNLLKAGFPLTVYNRSIEKSEELVCHGAILAKSLAEVASRSKIVLLCLKDGPVVSEILFGRDGMCAGLSAGTLVVDFSTISPSEAVQFGERLREARCSFVDAPVSGGDVGAREGNLVIMAGGAPENISRAKQIFSVIGRDFYHMGPVGSGQKVKAVNQICCAVGISAMCEGLALAEKFGLDKRQVLQVLTSGAGSSWSLENYGPRILDEDFTPGFLASLMLKDLRICAEEAKEVGLQLPALSLVSQQYEKLLEEFGEELGNHALLKIYASKGIPPEK